MLAQRGVIQHAQWLPLPAHRIHSLARAGSLHLEGGGDAGRGVDHGYPTLDEVICDELYGGARQGLAAVDQEAAVEGQSTLLPQHLL